MVECQKCYTQNSDDSNFCSKCGRGLKTKMPPPMWQNLAIVGVILLVVIIAVTIATQRDQAHSEPDNRIAMAGDSGDDVGSIGGVESEPKVAGVFLRQYRFGARIITLNADGTGVIDVWASPYTQSFAWNKIGDDGFTASLSGRITGTFFGHVTPDGGSLCHNLGEGVLLDRAMEYYDRKE